MKVLHMIAFSLLIVGGLNWFLLGVSGWEIGELFGGQDEAASKAVYILIGLGAIYEIATHKGRCGECSGKAATDAGPTPTA